MLLELDYANHLQLSGLQTAVSHTCNITASIQTFRFTLYSLQF